MKILWRGALWMQVSVGSHLESVPNEWTSDNTDYPPTNDNTATAASAVVHADALPVSLVYCTSSSEMMGKM